MVNSQVTLLIQHQPFSPLGVGGGEIQYYDMASEQVSPHGIHKHHITTI